MLFNSSYRGNGRHDDITIVSGLPRSGTSMMMRMIEAGGVEVVTDNVRKADIDNPRGYYELEKVKKIKEDCSWLKDCRNKAFKMVSELLYHLPDYEEYKILFMLRNMDEMLASQRKMLERLGKQGSDVSKDKMKVLYEKHLMKLKRWLREQKNMDVLFLYYGGVVANPMENAKKVDGFLGGRLNIERMSNVVEKALYRQRI